MLIDHLNKRILLIILSNKEECKSKNIFEENSFCQTIQYLVK